jgi:hypothetical protein
MSRLTLGQVVGGLKEAVSMQARIHGLVPRDPLEKKITIGPIPIGYEVAGVVILDWGEPHIGQLVKTAEIIELTGVWFEGKLPDYEIVNEEDPIINRSAQCALCTMANAVGKPIALDRVLSLFASRGNLLPHEAFERLAEDFRLGSKESSEVVGQTIADLNAQKVAFLMTLNPDEGVDSQAVLVVGARCVRGNLQLLVANSYPSFEIEGMVEELNPNLVWADAVRIAQQCISNDQDRPTIQVYRLNKSD